MLLYFLLGNIIITVRLRTAPSSYMYCLSFHVSVSHTPLDPSESKFYYWITVLLRVVCTGFNCQITTCTTQRLEKIKSALSAASNETSLCLRINWFLFRLISSSSDSHTIKMRNESQAIVGRF